MKPEHQQQLDRCRVPHYTGPFTFEHTDYNYYWIIKGPVPLAIAEQIHADPAADLIRVAGHCGCPAPVDPWITWRMPDGTILATLNDKAELDRIAHIGSPGFHQEYIKDFTFTDDPAERAKAKGYIETYHIDSEMGLRVFVDYLRWNGLL